MQLPSFRRRASYWQASFNLCMIDVTSANIESFQNIGDLPPNQLKNVQFIFLPLEQEGVFEVGHFIVWQKTNWEICSS